MTRAHLLAALFFTLNTTGISQDSTLLPKGQPYPFNSEEASAERLAYMRGKLETLRISAGDKPKIVYALKDAQPLRWSNPTTGVIDGGIFIWTDGERPIVVAKSFISERWTTWTACMQSVADQPLVVTESGQKVWEPLPDVKFTLVEDEKPDSKLTDAQRLIRMRNVARNIQITSLYGEEDQSPWELRLLTTPVLRYSSPSRGIVDGAVFAFTQGGTNPEALALVEIRDQSGVRSCRVAVARLSTYAHTAKLKETTISDVPRLVRFATGETTRSFYAMRHRFAVYPFAKSSEAAP
jgi:hypothetical protein